jgi:hypothetical protein
MIDVVNRDYEVSTVVTISVDTLFNEEQVYDAPTVKRYVYETEISTAASEDQVLLNDHIYETSVLTIDSIDLNIADEEQVLIQNNHGDTRSTYVGDVIDTTYWASSEYFIVEAFVHWIPDVFVYATAISTVDTSADVVVSGELIHEVGAIYEMSADIVVECDNIISAWGITGDGGTIITSGAVDSNVVVVYKPYGDRMYVSSTCTSECLIVVYPTCEVNCSTTARVYSNSDVFMAADIVVDAAVMSVASKDRVGAGMVISVGSVEAACINRHSGRANSVMSCEIYTWPVIRAVWDHYGVEYAAVTVETMCASVSGVKATLTVIPGT